MLKNNAQKLSNRLKPLHTQVISLSAFYLEYHIQCIQQAKVNKNSTATTGNFSLSLVRPLVDTNNQFSTLIATISGPEASLAKQKCAGVHTDLESP